MLSVLVRVRRGLGGTFVSVKNNLGRELVISHNQISTNGTRLKHPVRLWRSVRRPRRSILTSRRGRLVIVNYQVRAVRGHPILNLDRGVIRSVRLSIRYNNPRRGVKVGVSVRGARFKGITIFGTQGMRGRLRLPTLDDDGRGVVARLIIN